MSREISPMHAHQRDAEITRLLQAMGFISFKQLCQRLEASTATIRRDLDRLASQGVIERVRGGARLKRGGGEAIGDKLVGTSFEQNRLSHAREKAAIGRAAAKLCTRGEAIIMDGGTTTFQMCMHMAGMDLQVLTNSLHIVNELLPQSGTRVSVPGGAVFREQNIVLSPFEDDGINRYHASKLFMGAAAVGARGLMQADVVLIQAEQKLMNKADQLIVLVDFEQISHERQLRGLPARRDRRADHRCRRATAGTRDAEVPRHRSHRRPLGRNPPATSTLPNMKVRLMTRKTRPPFIWTPRQEINPRGSRAVYLGEPPRDDGKNRWFFFRRTFDLADKPERSEIAITVDGRYRLFVNGDYVGRGPVRANPLFQRYDTYDIAKFLRAGRNVIAVQVHVYGVDTAFYETTKGMWQPTFGDGGLWVDGFAEVRGERVAIISDEKWRCSEFDGMGARCATLQPFARFHRRFRCERIRKQLDDAGARRCGVGHRAADAGRRRPAGSALWRTGDAAISDSFAARHSAARRATRRAGARRVGARARAPTEPAIPQALL